LTPVRTAARLSAGMIVVIDAKTHVATIASATSTAGWDVPGRRI
jgi:hypothetical protein